MTDKTNDTADDIARFAETLADPDPNLDADQTTQANLRVIQRNQYADPQVATEGPTSIDPDQQTEMHDAIRDMIDFDAVPEPDDDQRSVTIDIGTVTYNGKGEVVNYTIDPSWST